MLHLCTNFSGDTIIELRTCSSTWQHCNPGDKCNMPAGHTGYATGSDMLITITLLRSRINVLYLMLLQWEEDKSSLPICIKSKLFFVTTLDNVLKTDSALYARCPFPAERAGCAKLCTSCIYRHELLLPRNASGPYGLAVLLSTNTTATSLKALSLHCCLNIPNRLLQCYAAVQHLIRYVIQKSVYTTFCC